MKKFFLFLLLTFFISSSVFARSTGCKEGNCENGYGKWAHFPYPFSQFPSLHPVLRAKTDELIKKVKSKNKKNFFMCLFYTKIK